MTRTVAAWSGLLVACYTGTKGLTFKSPAGGTPDVRQELAAEGSTPEGGEELALEAAAETTPDAAPEEAAPAPTLKLVSFDTSLAGGEVAYVEERGPEILKALVASGANLACQPWLPAPSTRRSSFRPRPARSRARSRITTAWPSS